jgi:hypothetical protein
MSSFCVFCIASSKELNNFKDASPCASMFLTALNPALKAEYLIFRNFEFFTFPKFQKKAEFGSVYREC